MLLNVDLGILKAQLVLNGTIEFKTKGNYSSCVSLETKII